MRAIHEINIFRNPRILKPIDRIHVAASHSVLHTPIETFWIISPHGIATEFANTGILQAQSMPRSTVMKMWKLIFMDLYYIKFFIFQEYSLGCDLI